MTDREKVIKGLESQLDDLSKYADFDEVLTLTQGQAKDLIALLKEQEAVTEYVMDDYQPTCKVCGFRPFAGYIPALWWMKDRGFDYCPYCGKAVKWDD